MPPIIHCVRHAQGFHNLGNEFHTIRDPQLTPLGQEQCDQLRNTSFPDSIQSRISLVAASPLTRTLHTAYLVFQPALLNNNKNNTSPSSSSFQPKQILALPDAQETSDYPCDTGSDPSVLRDLVHERDWPVDLSLINDGWNVKTVGNRYSPHSDAIKSRARDARVLLRQKVRDLVAHNPENDSPEVVLVTHGGYLHYFTDDWEDAAKFNGTGWANCETRSYVFERGWEEKSDDGEEDGYARLVETRESRDRRGKQGTEMGTREVQDALFELAMNGWEGQGLQRPDTLQVMSSDGQTKKEAAAGGEVAGMEDQQPAPQVHEREQERRMSEVRVSA